MDSVNEGKVGDAVSWFTDRVKELVKFSQGRKHFEPGKQAGSEDGKDDKASTAPFIGSKVTPRSVGRMMMFAYDPKTKDKLPYYDVFPLVIVVGMDGNSFTGLNLHYVPPLIRKKILDILKPNLTDGPMKTGRLTREERNKIKMSYNLLKASSRFDIMKPCFKKYLFSHVRSNLMYVHPDEWDKSIMLPLERFKKATKAQVFRESMKKAASTGAPVKTVKPQPAHDAKAVKPIKTTDFFGG